MAKSPNPYKTAEAESKRNHDVRFVVFYPSLSVQFLIIPLSVFRVSFSRPFVSDMFVSAILDDGRFVSPLPEVIDSYLGQQSLFS